MHLQLKVCECELHCQCPVKIVEIMCVCQIQTNVAKEWCDMFFSNLNIEEFACVDVCGFLYMC
jgi:hypothetical protein